MSETEGHKITTEHVNQVVVMDEVSQRKEFQKKLDNRRTRPVDENVGDVLNIVGTFDGEDRKVGVMGRIPTKEEDERNEAIERTAQRRRLREEEEQKASELAEIERNRLLVEAEKERQAAKPVLERMVDGYWDGNDRAKMEIKAMMAREGLTEDEIIDITDAILGGQHNVDGFAWLGRGVGSVYPEPPKMGMTTPDEQRQIHLAQSNPTEYQKVSKKHLGVRFSDDGSPEIADFSTRGTAVIRNGELKKLSKIETIAENPKTSDKWFGLQDGDVVVLAPDSGDEKVEIPIHLVAGHVVMEKSKGLKLGKVAFGKKD